VGGVLITAGLIGAGVYFGMDSSRIGSAVEKVQGAVSGAMSLVGLYKTGNSVKEVAYSPPPPLPGTSGVTSTTSVNSLPVSTTAGNAYMPPLVSATPLAEEVATPTPLPQPPVKGKRHRRRRSAPKTAKRPVKAAKGKSAAVKKAAPSAAGEPMVGSYVSLELITGRAVQGILEGKTPTHYILNVPGLGPLEYPVENVKSVQPAQ
jgi:hypothetical protein